MPEHVFRLTALLQPLENDTYLAETLFFPEVSCYAENPDDLYRALRVNAGRLVKSAPPAELHGRHQAGPVEAGVLTLTLEPPPRSAAWREPVELTLPLVRWSHGSDAHLAYVPALGIEVVAATPEERERMLPAHVRAALLRTRQHALHRLAWLQRCRQLRMEPLTFSVTLPSPKQAAVEAEEALARRQSVLEEVGTDLTTQRLPETYEADAVVTRLAEALTGRNPRSVLLVGPSGVGKTAALYELVRRRGRHGLARTPFWATSGSRLVAGMSGFGMWQERCQRLWREASTKRAILHLGNLVELLEVGKSEHRSQGVATFLRPYLGRGDLLAVAECTPEQVAVVERQDPHLLRVFASLTVEEPGPAAVRTILARFAGDRRGADLSPEALDAVDRLHRRYATYSANPGRPLRFLRDLLEDSPAGRAVRAADVTAAFARETGLPRVLLEAGARLDLGETRAWFAARVIGQDEAVDLVVDLLATVKAGLSRPRKPIASLLFIGPTGVGKTEMAKALAEFLFGSRQRLTRLDMSEYADPLAVQRLVGGPGGGEGVLTARVREQPFSVVLLDEVEKAHPQLFDLLLQVLGEGRLTDAAGRLADFCNSVVIMTSNLGAETFVLGGIGFSGSGESRARAREHFTHEVRAFLRPELFNRIDRIVPFAPLDRPTVLAIARRQLQLLEERDGVRYRGVVLDVGPEVAEALARKGYDPRYGARPLKRAIERRLLAPLAERMNGYSAESALRVRVESEGEGLRVQVRALADEAGRQAAAQGFTPAAVESANACLDLRRDAQRLQQCPSMLEVHNDIYRRERPERQGQHQHQPYDPRLTHLKKIRDEGEALLRSAADLEDRTLLALYGQAPAGATPAAEADPERLGEALSAGRRKWDEVLLALYLLRYENANEITLAVFGEEPDHLFALGAAYRDLAGRDGGQVAVWQFLPERTGRDRDSTPERRLVLPPEDAFGERAVRVRWWDRDHKALKAEEELVNPRKGVVGLALAVRAPAAYPRFAPEAGLHEFRNLRQAGKCLVDASASAVTAYVPPRGVERRGALGGQPKRRIYSLERGSVEDVRLGRKFTCTGDGLGAVLAECVEECLRANARALVEP